MPNATTKAIPATRAKKPKQAQPEQVSIYMPGGRTVSGAYVDYDRAWSYSALYRAWSIIAQSIGRLTIEVRRKQIAGDKIRRPLILDDPVYRMLDEAPNDEQTPYVWKENLGLSLVTWGNYYGVIERRNGEVISITALPPNRVSVERDLITNRLVYRYASPHGGQVQYAPSEIVHIPNIGTDGIIGKSPLALARETAGLGLALEAAGSALFGNGMMPSGTLTHPGKLTAEAKKRLDEYLERFIGPGKQRRVITLSEGMTFSPTTIPPEDAQFLATREFQVHEVAVWYGIPPHMLGLVKDSKYASIAPMQIEFVQNCLTPYALRIEQELTRKLMPKGSGLFVHFDLEDLMRGDPETQAKWYREMWGISVFSPNEIREKLDLDDIGDDGDKRAVPMNMGLLDKLGQDPPAKAGAGPGDGGSQSSPENGGPRGLSIMFRDAMGRVVHRELVCIRKMIAKHETDSALDAAIRTFYQEHEEDARKAFVPVWQSFALVLGRSVDADVGVSRYVASTRELLLQSLRSGGRETLARVIDAWSSTRADAAASEFMEAGFLN